MEFADTWIILGKGPSRQRLEQFLATWPEHEVVTLNSDRHESGTVHVDYYARDDSAVRGVHGVKRVVVPFSGSMLPNVEVFPVGEVADRFRTGYIDHAVPMAIAYALVRGAKRIVLCGCDYGGWTQQMAGTIWWLAAAYYADVDVRVPTESSLFRGVAGVRVFGSNIQ